MIHLCGLRNDTQFEMYVGRTLSNITKFLGYAIRIFCSIFGGLD